MLSKASPINIIFLFMIVFAIVVAAFNGRMAAINQASFEMAKSAVTLAISLIGVMALWLGIMRVVEAAGALRFIARLIRPVMVRLFPDVPAEHPAMSAMIMNIAASMLGLGNAATPMGVKAMQELDKLNPHKGTATNAMCLFLAINTSSITLLPISVINVRAAAGVGSPADIVLPTLLVTLFSTAVAIVAARLMARPLPMPPPAMPSASPQRLDVPAEELPPEEPGQADLVRPGVLGRIVMGLLIVAFCVAIVYRIYQGSIPAVNTPRFMASVSNWLMPVLMGGLLLFGYFRGVKVYEVLTEGAKEGFTIAVRIMPALIAIFVAISMFRQSGALELFSRLLGPLTARIGMPVEALPMAFIRPLSGSGAFGYMSEIVTKDPQSFLSYLVSTMQGSSETTFYVLAVYFGSVGISRMRHAIWAGLTADLAAVLASLFVCRLMWPG
jgi:spore maturation protein SpmA